MKLKLVKVGRNDFVPMVKTAKGKWVGDLMREGHELSVEDEIGHQLMAQYPGAFQVLEYGSGEKLMPQAPRDKMAHSSQVK